MQTSGRNGTTHPRHPGYRTFGYRRQATILAEFSNDVMDVVRIRFAGLRECSSKRKPEDSREISHAYLKDYRGCRIGGSLSDYRRERIVR